MTVSTVVALVWAIQRPSLVVLLAVGAAGVSLMPEKSLVLVLSLYRQLKIRPLLWCRIRGKVGRWLRYRYVGADLPGAKDVETSLNPLLGTPWLFL